jgi:hypothetical protein
MNICVTNVCNMGYKMFVTHYVLQYMFYVWCCNRQDASFFFFALDFLGGYWQLVL